MDPTQPRQPGPPAPGATPPVEWASPALGTPAPGNVRPDAPRAIPPAPPAETPRSAPGTAAPASAPPAEDEAPVTRAIFRDGQRLLYYAVNFARLLPPQRVYGHGRLYESLLTLALIRLHSGLERLIRAQMPLARGGAATPEQDQAANWRDMLLFLRHQYPRLVLPADALFLGDITRLRNQLVQGEILTVELKPLGHLAELGEAIFLQLDPGYRRWEPEPAKDTLPARQASEPATAAVPTAPTPAPVVAPPADWPAAGAQRPRLAPPDKLYCPTCGREVFPDDLWCPRCGENFTTPGAAQPVPEPPPLAAPPGSGKRRGVFARLLGVR